MKRAELLFFAFIAALTLFLFRPYFLENKVPLNGNLLISFFEPWASYKTLGFGVGVPAKPIGFDGLRIYYPTRHLVTEQIKKGEMPLWNPYQFGGNVLIGTYQAAVFFPPGILFLLLQQVDAWTIIVLLQPFLGTFFMYLFLKQIVADKRACFFGAITFGFSGMLMAWWEEMFMASYSVIFFPLLLYGIEKCFQKVTRFSFLVLCIAAFCSLSTGWFQMIFYSWIFAVAWIVYRFIGTKNKGALFASFLSMFLAGIVSAIHLLPSAEAFLHSSRSVADVKSDFIDYLVPIFHLVTYVAPDFYGNPGFYNYYGHAFYQETILSIGIVGFLFALYALFSLRKSTSVAKFFRIAWIASLSLGFSLPTSWFLLYTLNIPLLSTLVPSRIFFVAAFCASVLAAIGMQDFLKTIRKKQMLAAMLVIVMLLGIGFAEAYLRPVVEPRDQIRRMISLRNLIFPAGLFAVSVLVILGTMYRTRYKKFAFFLLIGIALAGIVYSAQKYLFFSEKKYIFPSVPVLSELQKRSEIDRFLGVGEGYIDRNFAMQYGLVSPEGYDSFNNKRYSELVYSSHANGKYSEKMPRADVQVMKAPNLKDSLDNPYRRRMISLLGIKHIVEKHGEQDYATLATKNALAPLVWTDNIYNIYENKEAVPRAQFVYDYKVLQNNQELLDAIYDKKTDLTKTVFLEENPGSSIRKNGKGSVEILSYTPSKVVLQGETSENGILVLTDNYYPGWRVTIDGKEAQLLRANYTFRGVVVPKGTHEIKIVYQPDSFRYGVIVSTAGIIGVIGVVFVLREKTSKHKS